MKTMYRAKHSLSTYGGMINEVEVENETEKMVVINGQREAKEQQYSSIHDTWEKAHRKLVSIAESRMLVARHRLDSTKSDLEKVENLRP